MKNPEMRGFTPGGMEENHTAWAKKRALEYVDRGQLKEAIDSMVSDLNKDASQPKEQIMMAVMMGLSLRNRPDLTEKEVRDFIEGFTE